MPSEPSTCANPLLLAWVKEWLDLHEKRGSKGATTYRKAYNSLLACPVTFGHPSEVTILDGLGEKMAKNLTEKMMEHCEANGLPMPKRTKRKRTTIVNEDGEEEEAPSPKKKARKLKAYVPAFKSGPYGIVLALSTLDEDDHTGITKQQVIALAQPFCNSSYTVPSESGKFHTAWSSYKTLINKELMYEKKGPSKRYLLTEDGWEVARSLQAAHDPAQGSLEAFRPAQRREDDEEDSGLSPPRRSVIARASESPVKTGHSIPDIIPQGQAVHSLAALPDFSPIILEAGSFTVELVIDNREVFSKKDRDYMQTELRKKDMDSITRALALGDINWVAKLRDPSLLARRGMEGDEVMLDYICERKRLDDLIGSIKEGRYDEQRFRLAKSGVKNVIYIIEEKSISVDHVQKYEEAVASAIAGMQVVNGYFVKKTQKMDDTINYLIRMTNLLKQRYENKPLYLIPTKVLTMTNYLPLLTHLAKKDPAHDYHITYDAFASMSSKSSTMTLRDTFLKMLMCIKGVSGEKALQIQKKWKTPNEFLEAYQKLVENGGSPEEKRKRRGNLVFDEMGSLVARKKIGKALSVKIAEVWGEERYD